jgi:Delta3-Delta2-enoyl-CoA isomerase
MLTARRYGGRDAAANGIVTHAVDAERVLTESVRMVAPHAHKDRDTLGVIKARMYADVVRILCDVDLNRASRHEGGEQTRVQRRNP